MCACVFIHLHIALSEREREGWGGGERELNLEYVYSCIGGRRHLFTSRREPRQNRHAHTIMLMYANIVCVCAAAALAEAAVVGAVVVGSSRHIEREGGGEKQIEQARVRERERCN